MQKPRILVVEDKHDWQETISSILQQINPEIHIDVVPDDIEAQKKVRYSRYDLITIDLSIETDHQFDWSGNNLPGMSLLRFIRSRPKYADFCEIIIITGFSTKERMREAFKDYNVLDFLEKISFNEDIFLSTAKYAIYKARMNRAKNRWDQRCLFTLTLDSNRLISSEISGPSLKSIYTTPYLTKFDFHSLVQRTDNLNIFIINGETHLWRNSAKILGQEIYDILSADPYVIGGISVIINHSTLPKNVWIQIIGPPACLGLPFELLHDGDYLCLEYMMTRKLSQSSSKISHKSLPFHAFLDDLIKDKTPLRILVIGFDSSVHPAGAETEASIITDHLRADLSTIGIPHQVTPLIGREATYERIEHALREEHYHIVHYAGQGHSNDDLPETNGVVLPDGDGQMMLDAAKLNLLFRDTQVQMVFLSCCLSARHALHTGRGDFHGTLEALVRADVPVVLGYRWTISNETAQHLADWFYKALWHTFSPGEALLEARKKVVGIRGRGDEGWAAPVLVVQNT